MDLRYWFWERLYNAVMDMRWFSVGSDGFASAEEEFLLCVSVLDLDVVCYAPNYVLEWRVNGERVRFPND